MYFILSSCLSGYLAGGQLMIPIRTRLADAPGAYVTGIGYFVIQRNIYGKTGNSNRIFEDTRRGRTRRLNAREPVRHYCFFGRGLSHGVSGTPASLLAVRAATKRKSESRFRKTITCLLAGSSLARVTIHRSARRHTVRARCRKAAAGQPPGTINCLSGGRAFSRRSIHDSSRVTS